MLKTKYFDLATQVIEASLSKANKNILTAAVVGELLVSSISEVSYRDVGFPSLGSLLDLLEKRGVIQQTRTDKGALAIIPTTVQIGGVPSRSSYRDGGGYRPLKPRAWSIFTSPKPPGRRFLNKETGETLKGLKNEPDETGDWVEVEKISDDLQYSWMTEFAAQYEFDCKLSPPDGKSDDWYKSFIVALNARNDNLIHKWNKLRSRKVAGIAEEWCRENKVNGDLAFHLISKPNMALDTHRRLGSQSDLVRLGQIELIGSDSIRDVIYNAISMMSDEELLEVPIKVKYLIASIFGDDKV